jgi:hypothetical protein
VQGQHEQGRQAGDGRADRGFKRSDGLGPQRVRNTSKSRGRQPSFFIVTQRI